MRYISPKGPRKRFSFLSTIQRIRYPVDVRCLLFILEIFFFLASTTNGQEASGFERAYRDTSSRSEPGTSAITNPPRAIRRALIDHTTGSIKEKRSYKRGRLLRTPRHILTRAHRPDVLLCRFTFVRTFPSRSLDFSSRFYRLLRAHRRDRRKECCSFAPGRCSTSVRARVTFPSTEIRCGALFKKGSIDTFI